VALLLLTASVTTTGAVSRKVQTRWTRERQTESEVKGLTRGQIKREQMEIQRELPKKGGSGKGNRASSYLGCLGLSSSNIDSKWKFHGSQKSCSYTHHAGKGGKGGSSSSGGSSGSGSGSGSGSSGSGSGSNGGNGDGGDNGDSNGDNGGNGGDGDENGGNGGDGNNGGNGGDGDDADGRNAGDDDDEDATLDESDFEDTGDFDDDYYDDQVEQGGENDQDGGDNDSGSTYDPYYDFDVETCDTYENLWIWDLSLTCESDESLDDCECIFAEELLDLGLLQCSDADLCPAECPICSTCMQLIGCTRVTTGVTAERTSNTLYVVAAAVGLLVFGLVYFTARRRRDRSELGAHLMENEAMDSASPPAAPLVVPPVSPTPPPSQEPTVWLAPDVSPAQFEPSARAAVGIPLEDPFDQPSILSSRPTFAPPPGDDQVWLAPVT